MRKIKTKRLVYSHNPNFATIDAYGGVEYDGRLSDENILGVFYEPGYWDWSPHWKNVLESHKDSLSWYMKVGTFYHYEKTKLELIIEAIVRILGQ